MIKAKNIFTLALVAAIFLACEPAGKKYINKHYLCDFEGAYWDALVDSSVNGENLLNGTITPSWHDQASDLAGEVSQPFPGYWEGVALSNHCSTDCEANGSPTDQLYAYVDAAYSGSNFLICNAFMNSPCLYFESKRSYIATMQVALTTYSYNATMNGNHLTPALGANESIWIEAVGYTIDENGVEHQEATSQFYLYKNGQPAFTGWKKWYLTSLPMVDKVVFNIKWDGVGEYNPYPAYFAIDDIEVVRTEKIEE
jgi:hypothetical protein